MTTISANIKVHILKTQYLLFKNYCYFVENTRSREVVLIDPSWEFELINHRIEQLSAKPCAVLVTHHHHDHFHLAEKCATAYNIPVLMSANEINHYHVSCANLQALPSESFFIGSILIQYLLTPGHTYGSTCYLINNHLFTGDTLFNEGCGICTGKGASPEQMFSSLELIKNSIQDTTLIYPGHQFYSPVGQNFGFVKEHNIYLHFRSIDLFVAFRMRKQNNKQLFNFK